MANVDESGILMYLQIVLNDGIILQIKGFKSIY